MLANSLINLLLFQIIFPFVSNTTNGNGEFINDSVSQEDIMHKAVV